MQEPQDLPRKYLKFPPPYQRVPRINRLVHTAMGLVLFPIFWVLASTRGTPGLGLRLRFASKGLRLLWKREFVRAYSFLVAPLDSVRYFEFDFMWRSASGLKPTTYLDVSSPRMLPLLLVEHNRSLVADLINPDKKDLPETVFLAQTFGLAAQCRFHDCLIEQAPLKPGSFDLITSMSVVEHIPDDMGAIRTMWDLLKPGGVLLLSIPCAATASEEYTNLNDYELNAADDQGYVFWQRYYDEDLIRQRIFSITGQPRRQQIYAENQPGSYDLNVRQKRSNPYYPYWREPLMMGLQFGYRRQTSELPGMGVIAMEFVKPL